MKRIHPVFNVVKLTPALDDPIPGRRMPPPPPPEIIDGEEEWVVEDILDSKIINQKLWYLVKWKGFGVEHNSWEPWENVHAPDIIADFYQKHPGAARHIQSAEFFSLPFQPTIMPRCHDSEGGGGCQRTPQSISHYSHHLRQSPIHPSTQMTEPPPAARDPTIV